MKAWEELTRKEQLECIVWDAYKDAHGFRPRHMNLQAMTEQELEAELNYLSEDIHRNERERKAKEAKAIVLFEDRVKSLIEIGASDRETAIRWILQAEDAEYGDIDFLCYRFGLPYGYFKEVAYV